MIQKATSDIELQNRRESTPQRENQQVVSVKNACKQYGSNKKPVIVLDGLNMDVRRGTIYGLLGASGCGKTTLLNCILGQRKLNSGNIWVFGKPPGSKGSGIPGPQVGYMPQETALYGDFTIRETLTYFGWIAGMSNERIQERFAMLTKLLALPETNQRLRNLSGGEQRRVSLASALLYEPKLLILDEPTVGVDPLLREDIWRHLVHVSRTVRTTIIMTTHYIEEARQADVVGLMRGGVLLAEDSPERLLLQHGVSSLEEVFLNLSITQNQQPEVVRDETGSFGGLATKNDTQLPKEIDYNLSDVYTLPDEKASEGIDYYIPCFKRNHMKALIWKNVLWWTRNVPTLVFTVVLSIFIAALFCICVGQEPHDLPIALVNFETNNSKACNYTLSCNSTQLSCTYFKYLEEHSIVWKYYDSKDYARDSVLHGETFASITVKHNFSAALRARVSYWSDSKPWDIDHSSIEVFRDVSNNYIANYLKVRLYDTFQDFIEDYLKSCDLNGKTYSVPIKWETPVYGSKYPTFRDFVMPGALNTTTFLLAVMLTSGLMVVERNEASLVRTFTLGITETELLFSHLACEIIVMAIQSTLAILTTFAIFDVTQNGSIILVLFFSVLIGFCGMSYGILISCICENIIAIDFLAMGTFIPVILLSGMIWPAESMHFLLRHISIIFPLNKPTESMRSILQRNWNLSHEIVYTGFICISVWTLIFISLSLIALKFRKS